MQLSPPPPGGLRGLIFVGRAPDPRLLRSICNPGLVLHPPHPYGLDSRSPVRFPFPLTLSQCQAPNSHGPIQSPSREWGHSGRSPTRCC